MHGISDSGGVVNCTIEGFLDITGGGGTGYGINIANDSIIYCHGSIEGTAIGINLISSGTGGRLTFYGDVGTDGTGCHITCGYLDLYGDIWSNTSSALSLMDLDYMRKLPCMEIGWAVFGLTQTATQ